MAESLVFLLRFSNEKSCSVQADLSRWKSLRIASDNLADYDVIKISSADSSSYYFGLSPATFSRNSDELFLNGLYASKLGLRSNQTVSAELLKNVPVCLKAWIEPVSVDDWEILEIHAEKVEGSLLNQIRVLWPGQVFPIWVTSGVCIFLRTVAIDPTGQCGILMPLTELIVEPKVNRNPVDEDNSASHKLDTRSTSSDADPAKNKKDESQEDHVGRVASPIIDKAESDSASSAAPSEHLWQRLLRIWIVRRIVSALWYIYNLIFRRFFPAIFQNFTLFQITSAQNYKQTEIFSQNPAILSKVNDFPCEFGRVFRIEDAASYSTRNFFLEKFDEAGYALLSYSKCDNSNKNDQDFQIFLVGIHKLPLKSEPDNNPTLENDAPITSTETVSKEAVIRLCVRSMSKFAMFLRENSNDSDVMEFVATSLKLSPVLRMQLKIGISSRVLLKKLANIPKPVAGNAAKLVFQSLDEIPDGIVEADIRISFEEWIKIVTDAENPLPLVSGSVFHVPVRKHLTVPNGIVQDSESTKIHLRLEKVVDYRSNSSSEYYLFSSNHLSSVELEFSLAPVDSSVGLSDIDPKIPHESYEGLIPFQKKIIATCLSHSEAVFRSRPISHKLCDRFQHPGFIMITGPSGMAKTYLGRVLLRKLATLTEGAAYVRWISCSNLKGKKPETIKKMLQSLVCELEWRQPSALLLDDFDQLVPSSYVENESSPSATYALQLAVLFKQLLSKLTEASVRHSRKILVVATAVSEQTVHPALLPSQGCYLFSKVVDVSLPETDERKQYLKAIASRCLSVDSRQLAKINFGKVANLTEGYSPKDFEQLVKRALNSACRRYENAKSIKVVKTHDFEKALSGFTPISLQDANLHKPKKFSWDDVGGLYEVRKQLTEKLVWPVKYAHLYQSTGMQLRSGILLYGPPGCGKTLLAGVVANECNLNFISVKGPELLSKYIGASEAAVRELFHRASAAAPCILFFDEFDSVAQKRGHDSTGVTDRVVNQILTHLDGVEPLSGVYVLAATSRPDLIDPAILRPGRLDTHLHCPMPDFEERCNILNCLLKKISLADEVNVRAIAARCENFTGADLRALVYDAQLSALHGYVDSTTQICHRSDGDSTLTVPSRSVTPSSLEMELDDQYNSNGFKAAINDMKDENVESSGSETSLTVHDFTKTAANLAKSLQETRTFGAGQYQICYGLSPPSKKQDNLQNSKAVTMKVESNDPTVIYFPSLYSKSDLSAALPESVKSLVNTISRSQEVEKSTDQILDKEAKSISVASLHFDIALESAAPSVSSLERQRYIAICDNFGGKSKSDSGETIAKLRIQQRATLA